MIRKLVLNEKHSKGDIKNCVLVDDFPKKESPFIRFQKEEEKRLQRLEGLKQRILYAQRKLMEETNSSKTLILEQELFRLVRDLTPYEKEYVFGKKD